MEPPESLPPIPNVELETEDIAGKMGVPGVKVKSEEGKSKWRKNPTIANSYDQESKQSRHS